MSFINAAVAHSYNFWDADIHFPPWEGSSSFLDMLEDMIYIVNMLSNKPMDPCVLWDDLPVLIIQA